MGAIGNVIAAVFKRPFIIIFFSIFALIYSLFGYLFPVLNFIVIANSFFSGDLFQSLVLLIQWVLKIIVTFKGILIIVLALVLVSFLITIVLAGFFVIINNTLDKKSGYKGEFFDGFKKYFIKVWFATIICVAVSVAFIIILMVAWIPALILTKAAFAGKSGFLISSILVDFITIGVTFFGFMFIRIYMVFWFPSIFINDKGSFIKGKLLVDNYFWKLVLRFLIIDIIFIIFQTFSVNAGTSFIFLPIKWIFNTVFFGFNIIYIFSLFKTYSLKIERNLKKQTEQNTL
jgi:hypothetical protein